jgi:hypothetical protein
MRSALYGFAVGLALGISAAAFGQAGPIGRPSTGGNLPQDFDTITEGIVAGTTQTQAGATLCTTTICVIATVGTTNDGIKLRQCTLEPMRVLVVNLGANSAKVYGSGTDTINGITTTTGIVQPAVSSTIQSGVVEYVCVKGGTAAAWVTH